MAMPDRIAANPDNVSSAAITTELIVTIPGVGSHTMVTGNLKDGHIFLMSDSIPEVAAGAIIEVTLKHPVTGTAERAIQARVLSRNHQGIGIEFLQPMYL